MDLDSHCDLLWVRGFYSEIILPKYSPLSKGNDIKIDEPLAFSPVMVYTLNLVDIDCLTQYCLWNISLIQHQIQNSHLNIQCSRLDPGICGGYGLNISGHNEVCFVGHTYTFDFPSEIMLYTRYSTFGLECHLWATDEAIEPPSPMAIPLNMSTMEDHKTSMELGTDIPLSPIKIYALETPKKLKTCESEVCSDLVHFNWHWKQPCEQNFYCSVLDGNVCGDFGLKLHDSTNQSIDVCHEKHLYKNALEHHMTIELWYVNSAQFNLHCHFWCHNDLAEKFWDSPLYTGGLLTDLVS